MLTPEVRLVHSKYECDHLFSLDTHVLESLSRRHVILLDTSAWIRIAEEKDAIASRVLEKLRRLKDAEKVVCPMAPATIWELRKQGGGSLHRVAAIMETLSENVTFRSLDQIYDSELDGVLHYIRTGEFRPLSLNQKFGPLLSYVCPGYRFAVPSDDRPAPYLRPLVGTLLSSMRLTTLVDMLQGRSSSPFPKGIDVVAARRNRRMLAGRSIERARRIETESVAKEMFIPALNRKRSALPLNEQLQIVAKLKSLPKTRRYGSVIEHLLCFAPALSAFVEVQTLNGLDVNRNDSPNDFFDCDLLVYAFSYAGTFAAVDKWITSLVSESRRVRYPSYFAFASDLDSLDQCLDAVVQMG